MVDGISFNGGYNNFRQYENAAKYLMGTTIMEESEGPLQGMGLMAGLIGITEGWKAVSWLRNTARGPIPEGLTGKDLRKAKRAASPFRTGEWSEAGKRIQAGYNEGLDKFNKSKKAQIELLKDGKWKKADTYKTVWNNFSAKTITDNIPKQKFEGIANTYYSRAEKLAKYAETVSNDPAKARRALKIADYNLAKAEHAAHLEKMGKPAVGFFNKLGRPFGLAKANGALKKLATKSPLTSKFLKFGKGNGLFLAIEGIAALFTIIPTFSQLGAGKGIKQTVKSTVKIGASIGGWTAGAAVGAAIGSIIPGAGTIVGGVIGGACSIIGGCIGSWAAGKVVKPIVGKDELEIAKEKQAEELAAEAMKNPETAQQLVAAVAQKLEQEGIDSEDAKIALQSIQGIAQAQPAQNQYAQNASDPSFSGNPFASQAGTYPASLSNPFTNYMDKDFMAMSVGLA